MILLCPSGTSRRREAPTTVAFICTAWICFRNVFFWNWLPPTLKYILYIQPGNIFSIFYSPTTPTRVVETLSLETLGRKGAPTRTSLNDGLSFSNNNSNIHPGNIFSISILEIYSLYPSWKYILYIHPGNIFSVSILEIYSLYPSWKYILNIHPGNIFSPSILEIYYLYPSWK